VAGFVAWELLRAVVDGWRWFPVPEVTVLAIAMFSSNWAKRRRRRAPEKRVRVTVFGVHADSGFFAFGDITTAWVGRLGEVVIETRLGQRIHLQTSHAVELQRVLMRHGVKLTTVALVAP
jgi:hypothetical protein